MAEDDLPYTENLEPYAIDVILKYVCLADVLSIVVNDLAAVLCGVKTYSSDRQGVHRRRDVLPSHLLSMDHPTLRCVVAMAETMLIVVDPL